MTFKISFYGLRHNLISFHNLAWILPTMAADSGRGVVDGKNDNVLNTETEEKPVDDELARLKKDLELLKNAVSKQHICPRTPI